MKRIIYLSSILLTILLSNQSFAQRTIKVTNNSAGLRFKSASFVIGNYSPSLKYLNDKTSISSWTTKFDGSVIFHGVVNMNVYKALGIKLEAGSWKDEARTEIAPDLGNGSLSYGVKLVPLTINLTIDFPIKSDFLNPYFGIGAGTVFVTATSERTGNSQLPDEKLEKKGSDMIFNVFQGFEFPINDNFYLGLELRACLGSYDQKVLGASGAEYIETVSLNGSQLLFFMGFKIN